MKVYELIDDIQDRYEDFSRTIGFYLNKDTAIKTKEKYERCNKCQYLLFDIDYLSKANEKAKQHCDDANIEFDECDCWCSNACTTYGTPIIREIEVNED